MSWNIHHTTLLSAAAGFAFGKQLLPQAENAENAIAIRDPKKEILLSDPKKEILLSAQSFKTAFIGLNLASAIYDMIPRQKTLVKTKQVLTTDDEGKGYRNEKI